MMLRSLVLCVAVALAAAASVSTQPLREGHVYKDSNGNMKFVNTAPTQPNSNCASGTFDPATNHISNFGVLKITTSSSCSSNDQMFAAGFLEASLTSDLIFDMYTNLISTWEVLKNGPPKNLSDFLVAQDQWARGNVAQQSERDPYWRQVGYILQQYDGLRAGYKSSAQNPLPDFAFFVLNGCGDLFDLLPATCPNLRKDFSNMTRDDLINFMADNGHCSAMVKLTGDYSNMFMAHSSWFRYQAMIRIMKHYNFDISDNAAKKITFSSYPGFLESLDDFYIMDSGLVMLQTTNSMFNNDLYKFVTPQTLFAWQRVRIGSALASTGEEWSEIVARHNSGTYNNQYMVIDLKRFTPQQPLGTGVLWVSEQIPGTFVYTDQTAVLERGYWPSYNVAFHPIIYNLSGYPAMVKQYGNDFSYDLCPRAKIFRRDSDKVVNMTTFQSFMRYNDYKNDPYSEGSPSGAICSRGDLTGGSHSTPSAGGCYDSKTTDFAHALKMQSFAINGPTSDNLPPFSWNEFPNATHVGMPTVFDFQWEFQDPQW